AAHRRQIRPGCVQNSAPVPVAALQPVEMGMVDTHLWRHRFILWVGIWAWVRRQRPTVTESARVAQLLFTLLSLSLGLGNTCAPIILCRLRLRWCLRRGF